jgi:peptidoglycan/LPS O-acetylase OafA/YrhL
MSAVMPGGQQHAHIPALDGIRGTAILLVLVHHVAQSTKFEFGLGGPFMVLLQAGWVGVDLFFVLSGFLITGILLQAKGQPHFFRNFYARRTLRIFPLYYGALAVVFFMRSATWPEPDIYGDGGQWWLWAYLTNVAIAFDGFGQFEPIDHFWSLAIEEQFYLVWPLVVWMTTARTLLKITVAVIVTALTLRIGATLAGVSSDAVYVLTPFRADTLATGALLAVLAHQRGGASGLLPYRRTAALVFGAAAMCFVAIVALRGTVGHSDGWMQTLGLTAISALFGSLLVLTLTQSTLGRVFTLGGLRWFGKYSYGLYVWHPIAIIVVLHTQWGRELRGGDGPLQALAATSFAVLISLAIAYVSWHLYEKRLLRMKRHFPTQG